MREPHHLQMRKLRLTEVKLLSKSPQVEKSRAVAKNCYLLLSQNSWPLPAEILGVSRLEVNPSPLLPDTCSPGKQPEGLNPKSRASKRAQALFIPPSFLPPSLCKPWHLIKLGEKPEKILLVTKVMTISLKI